MQFTDTTMEEVDIAMAAAKGLANPMKAIGTQTTVIKRCRRREKKFLLDPPLRDPRQPHRLGEFLRSPVHQHHVGSDPAWPPARRRARWIT